MARDRRTKEKPTPGQDPREIDRERVTADAVEEIASQERLVHRQPSTGGTGSTADTPGRDVHDLGDAPEVVENRNVS
jgi:hypothetical protein